MAPLNLNSVDIKGFISTELRSLTSLLATLLIMILSGRSMVLAMVSTTRRAWRRVGQSNRLYITFCFLVHNRSNYTTQGVKESAVTEKSARTLDQNELLIVCYIVSCK